jgi:hypothetical protein
MEQILNFTSDSFLEDDWNAFVFSLRHFAKNALASLSPVSDTSNTSLQATVTEFRTTLNSNFLKDEVDDNLDETISKLCISAQDDRKRTLLRIRDDAISYLGSPSKERDSSKSILLRSKGPKKSLDLRKIS